MDRIFTKARSFVIDLMNIISIINSKKYAVAQINNSSKKDEYRLDNIKSWLSLEANSSKKPWLYRSTEL